MPNVRDMTALKPDAVRALPGFKTMKQFEAKFAKKPISPAELKAGQRTWVKSVKAATVKQPTAKAIQAVMLTADHVDKLRAVHESKAATAELVNQKLDADQLFGIVYSSLTTLEYTRMSSEYKKRLGAAANKATVEAQWQKVVEGAQEAFAAGGLSGLKQAQLDGMATELNRKKANFNAVTTIANSAHDVSDATGKKAFGNFVTQTAVLTDLAGIATTLPGILVRCEKPLAEGSYTKHIGYSFDLQVRLWVWCPTWSKPWRFCWKTFTLAGVSFSVDLNVGYKITCCGAAAWGQAAVQACGTVIGITVCADCTASIIGVAGLSKTVSGSSCIYGLGVSASCDCNFAGINVFHLDVPFGWTITGPCPPAGFICP